MKRYQDKYISVRIRKDTYAKAKAHAVNEGRYILKIIDEAINNYLLLKKIK